MKSKMDNETTEVTPIFTNLRIIKNVLVLSFAFLLICTSVDGLQMLQSTLNRDEGIGVVSIAIQFAFGCVIALFFMKYFILKFGTKMTLTFCILAHIPSTVANFYPHWITMIPSYAIVGVAATLLWGSNSAYLNDISNKYADNCKLINVTTENESRYRNTNEHTNNKIETSANSFDEIPFLSKGVYNKNYEKYSTHPDEPKLSYTDVNHCDARQTAKNAKTIIKNKNITALTAANKMLTVFELANATLQTITYPSKTENTSSSNHLYKEDSASPVTNNIVKLNNTNAVNSIDKINGASTATSSTDKLSSTNSTINEEDKFDITYSAINSISPVHSTNKVDNGLKQTDFSSLLVESTTARFFGIHSMFYQSGHIWSNIVSFYVLQRGVVNDTYIHDSSCMCGAEFCNVESECFENNLKEPTKEVKYVLISIFLALNALAVLLTAIFLDPLENRRSKVHYSMDFALATFHQLKKPLQLLIVPLSIYMGMSQGFFYADYPKAFVGCAWGMHHVGLVTITFGVTCSVTSTLSGWLVKHSGRRNIFLMAAVVNVAVNIIMLLWTPNSNQPTMFFVVAGMWGALMGSFWSQLKAFHGVLFKNNEEAAFGCYELSHSIGACVSFACSNYVCLYVKIYMLLFVSSIGMIGYLVAEKIRPRSK